MIIETLLSLSLNTAPRIPYVVAILTPPAHSQVIAAYSSRSSFSSSRSSFSSSSRSSFSSRPSSSSFSRPSTSSFSSSPVRVSTPKPVTVSKPVTISAPKPSIAPSIPKAPSNNIVRINKQVETPKPSISTFTSTPKPDVASGSVSSSNTVRNEPTQVITRERYIERYNDGGIAGNPWFWMYMFDNNQPRQTAPTQVVVQSVDGKQVKVPESQLIVKKTNDYNPIREFFVFALGGGIGVLAGRKFSI